ncbi:MAG: hypothetical protein U9R42_06150 [Bacteroidota bacterium]|nr:hypothetical protein [Bacteroidota bacterium]
MFDLIPNLDDITMDSAISDVKEIFNAHRPYETVKTLNGDTFIFNEHFTREMINTLTTSCLTALSTTEADLLIQFIEWQNYLADNTIVAGSVDDDYVSVTGEKDVLIALNNWLVDELAGSEHSTICGDN